MAISTPTRQTTPLPATPKKPRRRRDDTGLALLFILPALIGFMIFMVWPTLRGIYLSFTRFNLLTPPEFNGLDNYVRMVQDPVFWNAMGVTLYYVVLNIGFQTVFALVIAVMMQRLTQKTWLRGIVLTPYLVSNVVAAMVFLWILDYQLGIGNQVLAWLGLDRIAFFTSDALVIPTWAEEGTMTTTAPALAATADEEEAKFNVGRALAWVFMGLVILASLFPPYWMLRTAMSSNNAIYADSGSLLPVQF